MLTIKKIPAETEKGRTEYFDLLRIIASFAVVMIHVSVYEWKAAEVTSLNFMAANFYDSLAHFPVPIFVMISGALFLGGRQTVGQIYKKSILRMVTAYLFWVAIYTLVAYWQGEGRGKIASELIEGHYHLWFLPMIVGLYAITPFLRKIVESESLTRYFLVLSLVLGFVLPQIVRLVPLFNKEIGQSVSDAFGKLHLTAGYASYFVLGYVLSRWEIPRKTERIIYLTGGAGVLSTFVFTAIVAVWKGSPKDIFYENLTVNVLLYSVAIFVFAKQHLHTIPGQRCKKIVRRLSGYSFGAYLVHALLLELVYDKVGALLTPWLLIPILTLAIFAASYLISGLLNQIPGLRKYIV